jgi:pimeloyl-ACP methyl ester carboxylesterase
MLMTPTVWAWRVGRRLPLWIFRPPGDEFWRAKSRTWAQVRSSTLAARLKTISRLDARDCLRACAQPVLCIASANDAVVPRHNLAEILRVRPSTRVVTIDGGHHALYTNAKSAARAIAIFIRETGRASAP